MLCDRFNVSRATVREAITHLVTAGMVEKRWGTGTFVVESGSSSPFRFGSISQGIPGGLAITGGKVDILSFELTADAPDARRFPDFPTNATARLHRVFTLDGKPVVAVRDHLVAEFGGVPVDLADACSVGVQVPELLGDVGVDLTKLDLDLRAAMLGADEMAMFGLGEPEPVIHGEGVGRDAKDRVILYVTSTYRTNILQPRITATAEGL